MLNKCNGNFNYLYIFERCAYLMLIIMYNIFNCHNFIKICLSRILNFTLDIKFCKSMT